jgi:broad specificity phosphatase PhoE
MPDERRTETFKVRTTKEARLAFDEWWAAYRRETGTTDATHGEAFEELLRRVGKLPPKTAVSTGKVFS